MEATYCHDAAGRLVLVDTRGETLAASRWWAADARASATLEAGL